MCERIYICVLGDVDSADRYNAFSKSEGGECCKTSKLYFYKPLSRLITNTKNFMKFVTML